MIALHAQFNALLAILIQREQSERHNNAFAHKHINSYAHKQLASEILLVTIFLLLKPSNSTLCPQRK